MNFPLQNIEVYLDEESLLRGESLLESGSVEDMREVEKNLWVAKVHDGRRYEVEVKLSPSRVMAATCDCDRYHDIGICEHLAATMFLLRRRQQEKKQRRQAQQKHGKTTKKLTTGAVLDSVSHEELIAFVRQYAKTNRNFALALKTRFAPQVSVEESKDKYLQLLDSAISMARKVDQGISFRGSQKIYKVLVEIEHQIEEAVANRYFRESFHIIQSIIEKITPIIKKIDHKRAEIGEQLDHSFRSLKSIIQENPPPALLTEIWKYGLEECTKLRYRNQQLDRRFFQLLLSLAVDRDQQEELAGKLDEVLRKYEYEGRNPAAILLLLLQILETMREQERIQALMDRYLGEPDILLYAVRHAMQHQDYRKAKLLADQGRRKKLRPPVQAELEETLLHIAQAEGDKDAIVRLSIQRLLESYDVDYLANVAKICGDDWPRRREEIITQLRTRPFTLEREELIGKVYARDQQWEMLLQHLTQTRSLELLRHFDRLLLPTRRQEVYQLYRQLLTEYLQNHLGPKPSGQIRMVLQHLENIKAGDLVEELVEQFRNKYPERHTLMEELSLF
jgi:hypothetical protein